MKIQRTLGMQQRSDNPLFFLFIKGLQMYAFLRPPQKKAKQKCLGTKKERGKGVGKRRDP